MYRKRVASCAERISEALLKKGIRPAELCKMASIPKSSMSLYISGAYEPKQDKVHAISLALNVSEAWLMGYDAPMERQDSPQQVALTEQEQKLLTLFRQIPEDQQALVAGMIEAALKSQGLL